MSTDDGLAAVRRYYASFDEWGRLDRPEGAVEFERALALINEFVPPASTVLDLGGGPGRYTCQLAADGHRVALVDLSPELVRQARARVADAGVADQVLQLAVASATDLTAFASASFDAALVFGPFYHLIRAPDRAAAAAELRRVLRPGGLALVSFIPRLSGVAALIPRAAAFAEQVDETAFATAVETGVFENRSARGFQSGWFPEVDEIKAVFENAGFVIRDCLSLRGIVAGYETELMSLAPGLRRSVRHQLAAWARRPELIATAGHAVVVVARPGS